jgi:hypothetical protein
VILKMRWGVRSSDGASERFARAPKCRGADPPCRLGCGGYRAGAKVAATRRRARVDVDGVAPDESVLVEVFAHQGRLKGAQFHKVARDALKLITLRRSRNDSRLILAFGDADAAACVSGNSWLAEALRTWGIEVLDVDLDDEVRTGLRVAQARQVMVNSTEV